MDRIYLDHSATTPTDARVVDKMIPYFSEVFGNASSSHSMGQEAHEALNTARKHVATLIGTDPSEIFFTSGGTEADNIAIRGIFHRLAPGKNHLITTSMEHHAVLHTVQDLEKNYGGEATYLEVDSNGLIDLNQLESAITDRTALVSVMTANNETGVIQPMEEIGRICARNGVLLHSDIVQAVGKIPIDMKRMSISLSAISAHKFYGPKGVGALYVRKGVRLPKLTTGGGQESGIRPGTFNTPGIVGMGEACRLATQELDKHAKHTRRLRDYLEHRLTETISDISFRGADAPRLPQVSNVGFAFVEGESILMSMEMAGGVQASSGSACTSGDLHASHVLLAMGISHADANGSIRFSFGKDNTIEQADKVIEILPPIIERLRKMSPLTPKEG